jgi:hypothetical protein
VHAFTLFSHQSVAAGIRSLFPAGSRQRWVTGFGGKKKSTLPFPVFKLRYFGKCTPRTYTC